MLKRGTGLRRGGWLKAQPCARAARRRDTGPDRAARDEVVARWQGRCCRCGQLGAEIQHRKPRRAGGTSDPAINALSNLILACSECHRHMESYRRDALKHGWLLHDGDDPQAVEVALWDGRWVLLSDDGGQVVTRDARGE